MKKHLQTKQEAQDQGTLRKHDCVTGTYQNPTTMSVSIKPDIVEMLFVDDARVVVVITNTIMPHYACAQYIYGNNTLTHCHHCMQ